MIAHRCKHGLFYVDCDPCRAERQKNWYLKNREKYLVQRRAKFEEDRKNPEFIEKERKRGVQYWRDLRHEVVMAYGGYRCACCGETEPLFLTIDHVNNDGAEHRRSIGEYVGNGKGAGGRTLKWLKDNGFPKGFQILCMNCNMGKARNGGVCPHCKSSQVDRVNSGEAQNG